MRALSASLLFVTAPSLALAAPAPKESWGKAGISLTEYRRDALECGLKGHYTDIAQTADAKEFVRASRELDTLQSTFAPSTTASSPTGPASTDVADQVGRFAATQEHIVDNVRPEKRYRNIKRTLEATTAQCLTQRGYSRFTLSHEQRRELARLKVGSDERRAYLYSLASNPAVLQSQGAPQP